MNLTKIKLKKERSEKLISKKVLALFLCFALIVVSVYKTNGVNASSVNSLGIHFIDVTGSKPDENKGDATLFECIGNDTKYVLVDAGPKSGWSSLRSYLTSKCVEKSGKIEIEAVIITHRHLDHYGGLVEMLKDSKFNVKKIYLQSFDNPYLNEYENEKPIKKDIEAKHSNKIINVKPDYIIRTLPQINGTIFTINTTGKNTFKDDKGNHTDKDTVFKRALNMLNNNSLVVDVKAPDVSKEYKPMTCIIMGDHTNNGFGYLIDKYKNLLSDKNEKNRYSICKYGHHGLRDVDAKPVEITRYRKNIGAQAYVFTTNTMTIKDNPNEPIKLKSALMKADATPNRALAVYNYGAGDTKNNIVFRTSANGKTFTRNGDVFNLPTK